MRRIVTAALALTLAVTTFSVDQAEAAGNRGRRTGMSQRSSRGGFFANLMEIERRKNAWLRATFFGR